MDIYETVDFDWGDEPSVAELLTKAEEKWPGIKPEEIEVTATPYSRCSCCHAEDAVIHLRAKREYWKRTGQLQD